MRFVAFMLAVCLLCTATSAQSAKRVKFQRGRSSAIVKGTVSAKSHVVYVIGAKAGQKMTTSISKNAGFRLSGPEGPLEGGKLVSRSVQDLETSGDYEIEVSSLLNKSVSFSIEVVIQ